MGGGRIKIPLLAGHYLLASGPLSARQRNAIRMAFLRRVDDGPTLNAGLVAL